MSATSTYLFLVLLALASVTDLRSHRIPNLVSLGGLALALALHTVDSGLTGLGFALAGMAVGFVVFVIPYAFSAIGAGDVKLMMMVGAFLGWSSTLDAVVMTLSIGFLMGVGVLLVRGGMIRMFHRYGAMFVTLAAGKFMYIGPPPGDGASTRFPYALAIAIGTALVVFRVDFF